MNKESQLPIIIFILTITLGLLSVLFSLQIKGLKLAEIFQVGVYPSASPSGGGCSPGTVGANCGGGCSASSGCDACNCPPADGNCCGTPARFPCTDQDCPCTDGDPSTICDGGHESPPPSSPSPSSPRSPSPSPSRSPGPSPSGSASPGPILSCTSLGPQPSAAQPGQRLTFTCQAAAQNTTINHYNFRVNSGTVSKVNTSAATANFNFTVPAGGGSFTVQCQVCRSPDENDCTAWGQTQ